jgi:hypothetical protein
MLRAVRSCPGRPWQRRSRASSRTGWECEVSWCSRCGGERVGSGGWHGWAGLEGLWAGLVCGPPLDRLRPPRPQQQLASTSDQHPAPRTHWSLPLAPWPGCEMPTQTRDRHEKTRDTAHLTCKPAPLHPSARAPLQDHHPSRRPSDDLHPACAAAYLCTCASAV